jgi:hypothetical protein
MSPVRLQSQSLTGFKSTVTLGVPPASISASADRLRNDSSYPALIDSLRFEISYTNSHGNVVPANGLPINVRIFKDRENLTNEFIPLRSFCKPHVRLATSLAPVGQQLFASVEPGALIWRFDKPLFMAPEDSISVDFAYDIPGGVPSGTYTDALAPYKVTVTGLGRVVPGATAAQAPWIPYATAFASGFKPLTGTPAGTVIQSVAGNLYNPKAGNLFVKDVLGYGEVYDSSVASPARVDISDTNLIDLSISGTLVSVTNAGAMEVGMDEAFNIGIRDQIPFFHAFVPQDRDWHFNAVLASQSYLIATLNLAQWEQVALNAALSGSPTYAQYVIGMVGHYKGARQ